MTCKEIGAWSKDKILEDAVRNLWDNERGLGNRRMRS